MSNSPTVVQRLADFVDGLVLERIPLDVIAEARRCILDTIGVIAAGQQSEVAKTACEYACRVYAPGKSHMPGRGAGLQAAGAAFVNACAGHAHDFDDTSYTGIMHGSVAVLPAALALAEQQQADGNALLEAFIAGVETEYAVAEFCTTDLYFRGWWTSAVYAALGAAAASAKLLGLDRRAIEHALSLAVCNANGIKAAFGSDAKPLGIGMAAARGIDCALLAQSGMTGPADVFENERGFLALYNDNRQLTESSLQLSERWRLLEPGILFKRYPVCSAAQAATELCADLLIRHALEPSSVARIDCEVPELVRISLIYDNPQSIREAQFSLPFALGCILTYGELGLHQLMAETLNDEQLREQMGKVSMRVPEFLVNDDSVPERCPEGAGIRLTTNDGREFADFLERPTGMPGNPVSDAVLQAKCCECLVYGGYSESRALQICDQLWQLESMTDLSGLMR